MSTMLIDLSLEDSNGEPPFRQPREGSNIHRNAEGKLLCSHSLKICNQKYVLSLHATSSRSDASTLISFAHHRRMEGYGFCSKHILEDPAAPFKQCDNVNPKSNKQCTNPVSLSDPDPRYTRIVDAYTSIYAYTHDSHCTGTASFIARHSDSLRHLSMPKKEKNLRSPRPCTSSVPQ